MTGWRIAALMLVAAALGACGGGNSTKAGITITAASATTGATSVTIPVNGTEQFAASVTGISSSEVRWQVCLPGPTTSTIPTTCTTIPGITPPAGSTLLTGYGTITQNGFYTAPSSVPTQNNFLIVATNPADITAFGTFQVIIDSGIRIRLTPSNATIDSGESIQFTATVSGTANPSITWEVNGVANGTSTTGTISNSGVYTAPTGAATATITALSGADGVTSATASVSVISADPSVAKTEPSVASQGSAEQEVYLSGTSFTSTGTVLVNGIPSIPSCVVQPAAAPCYFFLSASLLRVPLPAGALQNAGAIQLSFQLAGVPPVPGAISNAQSLQVTGARPSIVAETPASVTSGSASASVSLTGGFFSQGTPSTTVQFDAGNEGPVTFGPIAGDPNPTRRVSVSLSGAGLNTPGLYAITAQNPGVSAIAAVNVAVTPASIASAPGPNATISLGGTTQPSAIAVDSADGVAVVAEAGSNAVALISIASQSVLRTISVGAQPTGVAVDDLLPRPLAVVVNSGDNTVSVIDLTTALGGDPITPQTISLSGFTPTTTFPVAIGINPQTHRALVANASTNLATILNLIPDLSLNAPCNTAPCALISVGGSLTSYGTGANPSVAVDPGLNWAVVTPGGAGPINLVDLGFGSPSPGSGGRAPAVLASLSLSPTTRGAGINSETHQALFTDFNAGSVTEFSLLDNAVSSVTNNILPLTTPGEIAAAVNPFLNVGVAINASGSGTASIVDLGNNNVLQTITLNGGSPSAVVVDPATNNALIANASSGTVSVVALGTQVPKRLQILEAGPGIAYTSTTALGLTINGMGFSAGSSVLLDGVSIGAGNVTFVSARHITATVPAVDLTSPRRFVLQVKNTDNTVSNASALTVVQPITVETSPAGIAVDPDRDVALVTNSGSNDISVVSLANSSVSPQSIGPVGVIASVPAHNGPRAVSVLPRLGLGVAANYESNDLSLVDYSGVFQAAPYSLPAVPACSSSLVCNGPAGVAFNPDTGQFYVTQSNVGTTSSAVSFGSVGASTGTAAATITAGAGTQVVDQTPGDLGVAPSFDPANPSLTYVAIAAAAQTSVIDFLDTATDLVAGRATGVAEPAGIKYDWLNRVFLASDALNNAILMVDPRTFIGTLVRGGFNPTSIDYNAQTSTIVVVNGATRTLSVLDYLCPPSAASPGCTSPQVRSSAGLVGSQVSATAPLGPHSVAIDPRLNVAVLLDPENNRILLIPLP